MKKSNSLEVIDTKHILSKNQQTHHRDRLKHLLKNEGIISLCLDHRSLFVEYAEDILNVVTIRDLLSGIGFPMKERFIVSNKDIVFSSN